MNEISCVCKLCAYHAERKECAYNLESTLMKRIAELEAELIDAKDRFATIDDKLDKCESSDPEFKAAMDFARTGRIEAERALCGLPRHLNTSPSQKINEPRPGYFDGLTAAMKACEAMSFNLAKEDESEEAIGMGLAAEEIARMRVALLTGEEQELHTNCVFYPKTVWLVEQSRSSWGYDARTVAAFLSETEAQTYAAEQSRETQDGDWSIEPMVLGEPKENP